MKRIRCPKCDESITFDESRFVSGRTLVFECPTCHKQFRLKLRTTDKANISTEAEHNILGRLVVIENGFHFKQEIPLHEGDNIVGRFVQGTKANATIKTVDPSVDTTHCIVNASIDKTTGCSRCIIRDANSSTGTFVQTEILKPRERIELEDGMIITIGATTMIFQSADDT